MGSCVTCSKNSEDSKLTLIKNSEHALLDRIGAGQIEMLRYKFNQYEIQGGIDFSGFKKIMPYISNLPHDIIESTFNIFSAYTRQRISWTNFCATVAQYILGSRKEKCRFLYDVFDKKKRGFLSRDEINLLNRHLFDFLNTNSKTQIDKTAFLSTCSKVSYVMKFETFCEWAINNIDLHKALQPFEIIPSPVTEKEIYLRYVTELKSKGWIVGETYYLVSLEWLRAWKSYVRLNSDEEEQVESETNNRYRSTSFKSGARPIEVKNMDLLDPDNKIRVLPNMKEGVNFEIFSKEAWNDFHKWYGGGPEIAREALVQGERVTIEIYPKILKIFVKKANGTNIKDPVFIIVAVGKTVKSVVDYLKLKLSLDGDYRLAMKSKEIVEFDYEKKFEEYLLEEINFCAFEVAQADYSFQQEDTQKFIVGDNVEYFENGYWMSASIRTITSTEYVLGASWHKKIINILKNEVNLLRKPSMMPLATKGIPFSTGLLNIGNTCYMNSILQCLAHSPLINHYFTGQVYADLKRRNRGASKFKTVEEVENLLLDLRNSKELSIRPDRFYVEFTKIHKQFQGFEQHDTHEFLSILLSSLHEDLKFSSNTFSQTITLKGQNIDEERKASQELWNKYRGQGGSVISEICGGQTRNCLTCKNCTEKSTVFEVFNDFSVPIPIKVYDCELVLIVIRMDFGESNKVLVKFNKNDEISEFYDKIETKTNIKAQNLVFAYVQECYSDQFFVPETVDEVLIADRGELYAFEVISTVEKCEELGKKTVMREKLKNWRESLKIKDMVDVKVGPKWEVGIIHDIAYKVNILISIQKPETDVVLHSASSPNIKYYRSRTKCSNRILYIPLFHSKFIKKNIAFLSHPQVISIGSWYNFKDLYEQVQNACKDLNKKGYAKKKPKFYMYLPSKHCRICGNKRCRNCRLPSTVQLIEDLNPDDKFYVIADWSESGSFRDHYFEDPDYTETCMIHECFSKYTEQETIEIKCETCGHNSQDSQVEIWRLPDLLIIHLKRFSFNNGKFMKVGHLVKFPLIGLDMSFWMLNSKKKKGVTIKTTRENYLYDLYAVVNHTGGISGGHCTCFCKLDDGKWLYFDDDKVFQVTGDPEEEIVTKKAYILFYKRQRFRSGNVVRAIALGK